LEHGEKLQGKCLILAVPALAAMFLECAHDEKVDEVERLFGDFINGVALYEQHVFVAELHRGERAAMFEKRPLAR